MSPRRRPGPILRSDNCIACWRTTCPDNWAFVVMGPRPAPGRPLHRHLPVMADRGADGEAFRRIDDGIGVEAVVTVEVVDGAGLAKVLNAERLDAVAADAAEPA